MGGGFDRASIESQKLQRRLLSTDVLSKYVWIEPLRDKTSNCVIKAFQRVFSRREGRVPIYLQTDKGKEFIARPMQKFLKESDIRFRVTHNRDIKAAIVERFNKTLKERMWRYFTHTRRYIEVLQDIVRAYNHTRHSSRMQPAIVTRENACVARKNIARRWNNNDTNKKHGRKNTTSAISYASVEQKVPLRKDTRRSGARRYFEFVFSNGENLSCTN